MNLSKYVVLGERKLSSGIVSETFFDFKLLKDKENKDDLDEIVECLKNLTQINNNKQLEIVGIHTMGSYITNLISKNHIVYYPKLNKLSRLLNENEKYLIFDDVGTTFATMRRCINKIGHIPEKVVVIVNRKDVNLGVSKLYGKEIIEIRKIIDGGN